MWVSHELWLFRQQAVRGSRFLSTTRRAASSESSERPPAEPYDVSDLVFELDDIDNSLVRKYDDWKRTQDDAATVIKKPKSAVRRSKSFLNYHSSRQYKSLKRSTVVASGFPRKKAPGSTLPKAVYHPTNADFVSLALIENPKSRRAASLREVLNRHDVQYPRDQAEFEVALERLKETISDDPSFLTNVTPLLGLKGKVRILNTILSCKRLSDLSRVTGLISRTYNGCTMLAAYGSIVVMAIKDCLKWEPNFGNALKYVNGLCVNIISKSLQIGPALCDAGMYLAARAGVMPAVGRYIEIAITEQHPSSRNHLLALNWTRRHSRPNHQSSVQRQIPGSVHVDVLRLMTGWETGGTPDYGEVRKPCFASLVRDSHAMYSAYIATLARMGASEALWHEWLQPHLTPMPVPKTLDGQASVRSTTSRLDVHDLESYLYHPKFFDAEIRANRFLDAFLKARDLRRAQDLLQSIIHSEDDSERRIVEDPDPSSGENHELNGQDWQLMTALLNLYRARGIEKVDSARLWGDMHTVRSGSTCPDQLISDIERLLEVC